jgi:thiamine transporter
MSNKKTIRRIAECGILMALALALSFFKIIKLPSGGSVTLAILPLVIISARQGFLIGSLCGFAFGILLLINGPYIVHPIQFLLDYPLAYSTMGIAGIIKWETSLKATTATTIANIIKFHCHVIAGVVFFSQSQKNFNEALTFSYAYNSGHLLPETIICAAIVWFIAMKHKELCSRQNLD